MINLKNSQRRIKIDEEFVKIVSQQILEILDYKDFDLGIWITNNKTIREYNKNYRNKDKPTDILSFSNYPNLKAGERIKAYCDDDKNLGDLIISAEYVLKDAEKFQVTLSERIVTLLIHGVCHLLGYDHIEDNDFRKMRQKEVSIFKKLKKAF